MKYLGWQKADGSGGGTVPYCMVTRPYVYVTT